MPTRLAERWSLLIVAALLAAASAWGPAPGFPNNLGSVPLRGWRSWQAVGGEVDQATMERAMGGLAKQRPLGPGGALVSLAVTAGYTDVGLDGGYFEAGAGVGGSCHDAAGHMIVNGTKFPSLRNMTDRAHALNLTASWYLSADGCKGDVEKAAWPNGTFETDAADAVAFGFDGVKFDSEAGGPVHNITEWAVRLNGTGRPMMIENCMEKHPVYLLQTPTKCPYNFYRSGPDNAPHFLSAFSKVHHYLKDFLGPAAVSGGVPASRPGCFGYADMLSIGTPIAGAAIHTQAVSRGCAAMTVDEERTLFGLWCATSSPLVLGLDVGDDDVVRRYWPIIANERALAINAAWAGEAGRLLKQAPAGEPGELRNETVFDGTACELAHSGAKGLPVNSFPAWAVYSKRLPRPAGAVAVIAVRLGAGPALELTLAELLDAAGSAAGAAATLQATDVWTGTVSAAVTATAPWRPSIGVRNSSFVVFDVPPASV